MREVFGLVPLAAEHALGVSVVSYGMESTLEHLCERALSVRRVERELSRQVGP